MGKAIRAQGNIKLPPPLNFTFNWEDEQGYLGNINFPPPFNFTFNWEVQQGFLGNDDDDDDDDVQESRTGP